MYSLGNFKHFLNLVSWHNFVQVWFSAWSISTKPCILLKLKFQSSVVATRSLLLSGGSQNHLCLCFVQIFPSPLLSLESRQTTRMHVTQVKDLSLKSSWYNTLALKLHFTPVTTINYNTLKHWPGWLSPTIKRRKMSLESKDNSKMMHKEQSVPET